MLRLQRIADDSVLQCNRSLVMVKNTREMQGYLTKLTRQILNFPCWSFI